MKHFLLLLAILIYGNNSFAFLRFVPLTFALSTEKESYREGEKITFLLTITNNSPDHECPVILPHTQNTGLKFIYLKVYDKSNNEWVERYSEDRIIKMMVHDTGTVMVKWLKPKQQIQIPLYLNDFDNYYSYHTQIASHHSFGVPLFAGIYKVRMFYDPKGLAADSIYQFYNNINNPLQFKYNTKPLLYEKGEQSHFCELKITKAPEGLVMIEGKKYINQFKDNRYWYYADSIGEGGSNPRLVHISNLPVDSCSIAQNEYFYLHITDKYAEYVQRFDNGDIKEYRKFVDTCPEELFALKYNDARAKIYTAAKLDDGRFYNASYHDNGLIKQEMMYAANGATCTVTDYIYNEKNILQRTKTSVTRPCIEDEIDGKSHRKTTAE